MRLLSICLLLAGAGLSALAQTNPPSKVRELSLQDCIELALKHNLDLQIERYSPRVALYSLGATYGAYDPVFTVNGEHDHNEAGSRILGGGFTIPGSTSDADIFGGGINGLLPWGTTYNLQATANNTYGTTPRFGDDFSQPLFYTPTIIVPLTNSAPPIAIYPTNYAQTLGVDNFENTVASVSLRLTQPLLKNFWIDNSRLNIRVAKNRLKYSELGLKLQIMQTITTLEKAYYDLIYDRENVIVQEKALELALRSVAETKKKVEVGMLAPLDEKDTEAQAESSKAALIAARSTLALQEHLVKQLITDRYREWADVALAPSGNLTASRQFFNLQDSWSKGLTRRPELLQAKLDLEKAGIQLKYDRNQLFPELDVFGTVGYNGSGKEFSGALYDIQQMDRQVYSFGGLLTIPLANVAARNNYKSGKATLEQAVLMVKRWERDVMVQIDNDIKQAQSSFEQVGATRAAREFAEAALDAEQKKLESGKSTTYTVLQKQRDLTTARGNEIQALDTYNKNLSQLSVDEGSILERFGVTVEYK